MFTITLKLTPLDVLFFRDARPFGAADHGESSLPTPQSFAGLIKTHLMAPAQLQSADLHGLHDPRLTIEQRHWFTRLRCRGPWLYVDDSEALRRHWWQHEDDSPPDHFPPPGPLTAVPADLVQIGKSLNGASRLLRLRPWPRDVPLPGWHPPLDGMRPLWHRGDQDIRPVQGKLLDLAGLREYLEWSSDDGVPSPECVHEQRHLLTWDSRTGIGVNPDSHTAAEGQIYSARFLQLRPGVCFVGEIDLPASAPPLGELFEESLVLPWGGEGRRVRVDRIDSIAWPGVSVAEAGERLLTALITPGIFHSRDSSRRPLWKPYDNGQLIAAAVPKPLAVSGWDLAGNAAERRQQRGGGTSASNGTSDFSNGRPRPTRFAVPAGSVYLWQRNAERSRPESKTEPAYPRLCDKPQDHDTGWGVALIGTWKPCDLGTPNRSGLTTD